MITPHMLRLANVFVTIFLLSVVPANAQKTRSAKSQAASSDFKALLNRTRRAVVQVKAAYGVGEQRVASTGTGFAVSPGGVILTCNHVVTTRSTTGNSTHLAYIQDLSVTFADGREEKATVLGELTDERVFRDYAVLKINRKTSDYLVLGDLSDVLIGDDLIAWGFPLGLPGPVLIKASVATMLDTTVQNTRVQAIVFQGPNNKGMSGGPVVSANTGRVVGITSNRIAGISKELDETRNYIRSIQKSGGSVRVLGVDPNAAIVALTDTLDKYLMSGMGVAITVDHIRTEIPK